MSAPPPPLEPVPLSYHAPNPGKIRYIGMPELFLATVFFAAAHWTAEYTCQSFYHLANLQPLPREYSRALDARYMNMMEETLWIAACAAAFLITQSLMRPNAAAPVRPRAWLVAAAAGVAVCLSRWLFWYVSRGALSEFPRFCAAIILTITAAAAVSVYRFPERNFEL